MDTVAHLGLLNAFSGVLCHDHLAGYGCSESAPSRYSDQVTAKMMHPWGVESGVLHVHVHLCAPFGIPVADVVHICSTLPAGA